MVRGTGRIHLGGPPIVKAAINEIVDGETLGGAEMRARCRSGATISRRPSCEALAKIRDIVRALSWPKLAQSRVSHGNVHRARCRGNTGNRRR